jgi:hypothetical protein
MFSTSDYFVLPAYPVFQAQKARNRKKYELVNALCHRWRAKVANVRRFTSNSLGNLNQHCVSARVSVALCVAKCAEGFEKTTLYQFLAYQVVQA